MARFGHREFDGLFPRLSARLLPEHGASVAHNLRFKGGHVEPLKGLGSSVGTAVSGAKTLYQWRYRDAGDTADKTEWLSWAHVTGVERSPVHGDQYWRVYHTDSAGRLQCRMRKAGATTTRAAGIAAPAAPVVTVEEVLSAAALRGLANTRVTVTATAKLAVNGTVGAQQSVSGVVAALSDAFVDGDGRVRLAFALPELSLPRLSAASGSGSSAATVWWEIAVTGLLVNNTAVHFGGGGSSVTISSSGTALGTLTYDAVWVSDMSGTGQARLDSVWSVWNWTPRLASATQIARFFLEYGAAFATAADVYYVQSRVDDVGEESPSSGPSGLVHLEPGQRASVGAVTLTAPVTARRIYRTGSGSDPANDGFYFVAETGAAAFKDSVSASALGEALPRIENPPAEMHGLVGMAGGWLAAFKGRDVFFSEPFLPYSWPERYRVTVADEVVALAVADRDLYVLTRTGPWVVTGSTPETTSVASLALPQGCVAARSVATDQGRVYYASPDGLVALSGGSGRLETHAHVTRVEWQAWGPEGMVVAAHDGALVIARAASAGGLVWELAEGTLDALSTHGVVVSALWRDAASDTLYVAEGTAIKAWGGGAALTLRWRSRAEFAPVVMHVAAVRAVASAYPVTVRLFAGESLAQAAAVTLGGEVSGRVPRLRPERVWAIEVEGAAAVHELMAATSVGELAR